MQTFLPYPDFEATAAVLDDVRLGKQRVEAFQLLRALAGITKGWRNHPAARMWRGYEVALADYGLVVARAWIARGKADTVAEKITDMRGVGPSVAPPWLGLDEVHASHRSNLLRKDPDWYGRFGWTEPADLPYHWPA